MYGKGGRKRYVRSRKGYGRRERKVYGRSRRKINNRNGKKGLW